MNISIITSNISSRSGWGRYSLSIVDQYERLHINYNIITEKEYPSIKGEYNILLPLNNPFNFLYNIYKVRQLTKRSEIVHAFDGWPYSVYAYFAVLGTNKKLFINGVGTYSVLPFDNFIKSFFLKRAYCRAKRIFCISHYTKNKILEKIKLDNLEVVLLGKANIPKIDKNKIDKYNMKHGITDNNYPIFLSVGAIKARKGQYYSTQAISKLYKEYPNFRYFILGSDADRNYVNIINKYSNDAKISENVIIINDADEEELAFFYSISDIFILNSVNDCGHFEGFGLVFLEAAAFGLPVIGSRDCGIEDALIDGHNGYLSEQKNIEDIYRNILKILKSDGEKLRENSIKFSNNFSWDKTVKQYLKYYDKNN